MAKRKVSDMSFEELKLYKEQLETKLTEVNFYLQNCQKSNLCGLGKQIASSQTNAREEV